MKKMLLKLSTTALILFLGFGLGSAASDSIIIVGNVSNADGEGISGVSVVCSQNSSFGTTTDSQGDYDLTIPRNTSLSFSKAGYQLSSSQQDCPLFSSSQTWDVEMSRSSH